MKDERSGAEYSESNIEDDDDLDEDDRCAECQKIHKGLWIQCDICNLWFCEDCVPIIKSLQRRGENFYCEAMYCQRARRLRERNSQRASISPRHRLKKMTST